MTETTEGQNQLRLFTVGHSNYSMADFVGLLRLHDIEVVADVRSNPYSRYATHFHGPFLKKALSDENIKYVFLGDLIGGKPKEEHFYDSQRYCDYAKLAASDKFKQGMERLQRGLKAYKVAIMCGEEDPSGCHRHLLISRVAHDCGIVVKHIRKSGELQDYETFTRATSPEDFATQLDLFSRSNSETEGWRSQSRINEAQD